MFDHVKRVLRLGPRTHAVLLQDVEKARQDPVKEQQVKEAVNNLGTSLRELELRSYALRKELASLTLNVVNKAKR